MAMNTPQDLYLHELADIYDAEQRIAKMLQQIAEHEQNGQLKQALQQHEQETRQQIQNLEQCFQLLGSKPQGTTCYAVQGLAREHDEFMKEKPSSEVATLFHLGAAHKTEHYEIASYRGLVEKARMMGQQELAQLLQQNLQQEEQMAQRAEQMGRQLGQQMMQQGGQAMFDQAGGQAQAQQ